MRQLGLGQLKLALAISGRCIVMSLQNERTMSGRPVPAGKPLVLTMEHHLDGKIRVVSNTHLSLRSQLANSVIVFSLCFPRSEHSHMMATLQASARSIFFTRRSRSTVARNFSCQNSVRVVGLVIYKHLSCRCQKHPCTKQAALNFRRTMSGAPASLRSWRRYLKPCACSARRKISSGFVSFPRIRAIIRERTSGSTMSIMSGYALQEKIAISRTSQYGGWEVKEDSMFGRFNTHANLGRSIGFDAARVKFNLHRPISQCGAGDKLLRFDPRTTWVDGAAGRRARHD